MKPLLILALLLAIAPGVAAADSSAPNDAPLTVADVAVRLQPTGDHTDYPKAAQAAGVSGKARALCVVARDGKLADCKVVSETPAGYDFGTSVLKMASDIRVAHKTRDGAPTAGRQFSFGSDFKLPPTWSLAN